MERRRFLKAGAAAAAAVVAGCASNPITAPKPLSLFTRRKRGFNLLEKFTTGQNAPYRESDFMWMAGWTFDFVRLPMSYHCWSDPGDWLTLDEKVLKEIDQAVEFGRQYGIHVNLNLHRAPGYCVNPPAEPMSLWKDPPALEACAYHWKHFAERYKGIPNDRLSFDLLNEPPDIPESDYVRIMARLAGAIREADPDRLIVVDGLKWGREPVFGLAGLGLAQSTRGYDPMRISHYQANWVSGSDAWPLPTWPLVVKPNDFWNKERLRKERILPWKKLEQAGVYVHVGEWGAYNRTPHTVVLKWMEDCLSLWKEAGWGWALWNLRGSFGILDSGRKDVPYEDFQGHRLDRRMLELLLRI